MLEIVDVLEILDDVRNLLDDVEICQKMLEILDANLLKDVRNLLEDANVLEILDLYVRFVTRCKWERFQVCNLEVMGKILGL